MRKVARAAVWTVLSLLLAVLVALFAVVVWARSDAGGRKLSALLIGAIEARVDGKLRIGGVSGDLTHALVLHGVELFDRTGTEVLRIERLSLRYALLPLLHHRLRVSELGAEGVQVWGHAGADGALDLLTLPRATESSPPPGNDRPLDVEIDALRVDARVNIVLPSGPIQGTLRLAARVTLHGDEVYVKQIDLDAATEQPARATARISGEFHHTPALDELSGLHVVADTDGAEVQKVAKHAELRGPFHVDVHGHGPISALAVTVLVTPAHGRVDAQGTIGLSGGSFVWSAGVVLRGFDPGDVYAGMPHGSLELKGRGSGVDGRVEVAVERFQQRGAGAEARLHGELSYDGRLKTHAVIDASAQDLAGLARFGVSGISGSAELHGTLDRTNEPLRADAQVTARGVGYHGVRVDTISIDARLRGLDPKERISGALTVASGDDRLRGTFDLPLMMSGDLPLRAELTGSRLPIARFAPSSLAKLKGAFDVRATLSGTPRAPRLDATLDVPRWDWDPWTQNRTRVTLRATGTTLDGKVTGQIGANAAVGSLAAELSVPIGLFAALRAQTWRHLDALPITLTARLEQVDLARLPLSRLGLKSGHADLHLAADYRNRQLKVKLDSELDGARWLEATSDSAIDLQHLGAWRELALHVDATIPAYDLSHHRPLKGRLSGQGSLRGTIARPVATLSLSTQALRVGEMSFSTATASATWDLDHATLELAADEPGGGHLRAGVDFPSAPDGKLSAHLTLSQWALALGQGGLGPLRELRGHADAELAMTGTRAHPEWRGTAHVADGRLALSSSPLVYDHLGLDLSFEQNVLQLKKLTAQVGNGWLRAHGSAELDGLSLPNQVSLMVEAKHFPFEHGSLAGFIDADAELHGERKNGLLTGVLTVNRGAAQLPKVAADSDLQSTGPLADVTYTDGPAQREREEAAKEPRAETAVKASITAHIAGPFRVRSKELRTDLKGDLKVELAGSGLRLGGLVESTWGVVDLLGRPYQLERARVTFDGSAQLDPQLDLRLTRSISETTVVIQVYGTASNPRLELSTEPPIYDRSQILAIIVSGDPGSAQSSDAQTDRKVVGAISGVVVNQIKDQIASALPIDVIRIAASDGTTAGTGRLEVGKYVTDRIYLSYVHQLGAPTGIHPVNSNEAQVQFRFKRHYQIVTKYGDAGVGAIDFYWSLRY